MDSDAALNALMTGEAFVPRRSEPLEGTESAAKSVARVKYTHDSMIDFIIAHPGVSQNTVASHFGYTAAWISRIFNSDAFQARLAVRKGDLVDPTLLLTIDERLKAVVSKSLDIVQEKLETVQSLDTAFRALELGTKALGYGARQANVNLQQNFVVAMPQKAASAEDWAAKHQSMGAGQVIDMPTD